MTRVGLPAEQSAKRPPSGGEPQVSSSLKIPGRLMVGRRYLEPRIARIHAGEPAQFQDAAIPLLLSLHLQVRAPALPQYGFETRRPPPSNKGATGPDYVVAPFAANTNLASRSVNNCQAIKCAFVFEKLKLFCFPRATAPMTAALASGQFSRANRAVPAGFVASANTQ